MSQTQDLPGQQTLPGMGPDTAQPQPPQTETPELTYALLRDFEKQEGCDRYSADSQKIKLISDYAWVRRLTPDLTFEQFLERYQAVADFDAENRKHPDDSLKYHCPRAKSQADKAGKLQWSASEVVDLLVLYVDACRLADQFNMEPLSLEEFLAPNADAFKEGKLAPPEKPTSRSSGKKKQRAGQPAPADPVTGLVDTNNPLRPSAPGQRVIYAHPTQNDRQIKGVAENIIQEGDRRYVDFRADSGELIQGANILHFVVCDEKPPQMPDPVERKKLWIPKTQMHGVQQALALTTAMGNVPLGEAMYSWEERMDCGLVVDICIVNGETGPYVDATLVDESKPENEQVIADEPPRKSVLGEYTFESPHGCLCVEVCSRQ